MFFFYFGLYLVIFSSLGFSFFYALFRFWVWFSDINWNLIRTEQDDIDEIEEEFSLFGKMKVPSNITFFAMVFIALLLSYFVISLFWRYPETDRNNLNQYIQSRDALLNEIREMANKKRISKHELSMLKDLKDKDIEALNKLINISSKEGFWLGVLISFIIGLSSSVLATLLLKNVKLRKKDR